MATRLASELIENLQQIEAVVAGPDDANRLFTIAGQFVLGFSAVLGRGEGARREVSGTYTLLLGPRFTRRQFSKAIASVWLTKTYTSFGTAATAATPIFFSLGISGVDADWDDESGQVELRFDVYADVGGGAPSRAQIDSIAFQVTILGSV